MRILIRLSFILLLLALAACSSPQPTVSVTETPTLTNTPRPSATSVPTETAIPTLSLDIPLPSCNGNYRQFTRCVVWDQNESTALMLEPGKETEGQILLQAVYRDSRDELQRVTVDSTLLPSELRENAKLEWSGTQLLFTKTTDKTYAVSSILPDNFQMIAPACLTLPRLFYAGGLMPTVRGVATEQGAIYDSFRHEPQRRETVYASLNYLVEFNYFHDRFEVIETTVTRQGEGMTTTILTRPEELPESWMIFDLTKVEIRHVNCGNYFYGVTVTPTD